MKRSKIRVEISLTQFEDGKLHYNVTFQDGGGYASFEPVSREEAARIIGKAVLLRHDAVAQ